MPERDLYLAAYDVADRKRLRASLELVKGHATGGQKSFYEVFLTAAEKAELLHEMALILDEDNDRFFLLKLDPRARVYTLGVAVEPVDPPYFYVG
ncbi:MAG: CRISPR-associated endonuclease Cas2 [Steroidobacteraceae bacterium]|nr:CRISPR-associated endonuclease Cas2 [Steroidobacteraceae bacterium]